MFIFPMFFMLVVTLTSLVFTLKTNIVGLSGPEAGWCGVRAVLSVLLIVLAVVLAVDGVKTLSRQKQNAK